MYILGISFLSEASVALIQDGKIVSAVSEERFNREKLFYGYPEKAIEWTLANAGLTMKNIDVIATTGDAPVSPPKELYEEKDLAIRNSPLPEDLKNRQIGLLRKRYHHDKHVFEERIPGHIAILKQLGPEVIVVDHHMAHAASVYYTSGWDEVVIVTADGWGENSSNLLAEGKNGKIRQLSYSMTFDSLGYYYGSMTKHLGFVPHRHEGKVLGLAAHGDSRHTTPIMRKMVGFDKEKQCFVGKMEEGIYVPSFDNPNLDRVLKLGTTTDQNNSIFSREDISAGLQEVLEEVIVDYVKNLKHREFNLCLAGGIFANVRVNQKLFELPEVKNIYIYPNMGGGGLSAGAALLVYATQNQIIPVRADNVYLGPEYSEGEILSAIVERGMRAKKCDDIAMEVAKLLSEKKIVAFFNGKMEWGPRALGGRSILSTPTDRTANDWLNKKLARTEFMPFAPVTTVESAKKCYKGYDPKHVAADFMTITYDCTDEMKKTQPAVVHVDGTARPQIIRREVNPVYYDIVKNFEKLTGLPSIINTSFNMHEEPIVCTPQDAIRSFNQGALDYLAIGDYLISMDGGFM